MSDPLRPFLGTVVPLLLAHASEEVETVRNTERRPLQARTHPTGVLSRTMGTSEERTRLERDLLRKILAIRSAQDVGDTLGFVLRVLVEATDAQRGFLEVHGTDARAPRWSLSHGCNEAEAEQIRAVTSRGIVASALAARETLHVPFAAIDDRFGQLESVRDQRLEAILCAPIGDVGGGVLYLEGRRGAGAFSDADVALAEEVALHVGPAVELASRRSGSEEDPMAPFRRRLRLDGILGRSVALARVFEQLEPFMRLDVTMLITGAHGTGKTQLARAVHDNSPRAGGPFVELNCAAIPEGLIESELFGAMAGAYTGATRRAGKVEAAEGGTLFLDEVGEIPFAAQGKLLQLLQSHQYYALASNRLANANIRVIAATNANMAAAIEARRFREDLYYRLNIVSVRMPALSERRGDVGVLVDDLLARIAGEHRLPAITASPRLRMAMEAREWVGNIRELRNELEFALVRAVSDGSPQLEVRHLRDATPSDDRPATFHEATRAFQRDLVRRELEAASWNVPATAERLDLSRAHVYNLINQFALKK